VSVYTSPPLLLLLQGNNKGIPVSFRRERRRGGRQHAPQPYLSKSFSNGQRAIRTQHIDQFEKNAPADCDTAIRG